MTTQLIDTIKEEYYEEFLKCFVETILLELPSQNEQDWDTNYHLALEDVYRSLVNVFTLENNGKEDSR